MPFLRQNTAQTVRFGPFLDITDGVTPEIALTITEALMRLSKDGASFSKKNAGGNATHDSGGWYFTTFDTTDTGTVGELIMNVQLPSEALPVWLRWWVLEEAIYDALYSAGAVGYSTFNAASDAVANVTLVGTTTTNSDMRGTDGANVVVPPSVAQFDARSLPSGTAAAYFDPAADVVGSVTLVNTTLSNFDMRGTDGANTVTPLTAAQVNAEVIDVIRVDNLTLPGQVIPSQTPTLADAITQLYKMAVNEGDQSATLKQFKADNGSTVDQKRVVSSSGGLTTVEKILAGP